MPQEILVNRTALLFIVRKVQELEVELPGIRLVYINAVRNIDFDDTGWSVMLPFYDREEAPFDRVYLGETLHIHDAVTRWHLIDAEIREKYALTDRKLQNKENGADDASAPR
jgi:hypothetical protein